MKNNRIGKIVLYSNELSLTVIEYIDSINCTVMFNDGTIIYNKRYRDAIGKRIKNPNHPSVYGVGYLGIGKYQPINYPQAYKIWRGILQRCYIKRLTLPTYQDVTVCAEWKCFQNFAKWFENNFKPHMIKWHLDKDILLKGNKVYSPETCCFVPHEVNNLFRATYKIYSMSEKTFQTHKTRRELRFKEVADKWIGLISDEVYEITYNYKIER